MSRHFFLGAVPMVFTRLKRSFTFALLAGAAIAVAGAVTSAFAATPTVTGVSPTAASNTGSVLITITGTNLDATNATGMSLVFNTPSPGSQTIPGTSFQADTDPGAPGTQAKATFNIENASPGSWDVIVSGPDGPSTCSSAGCRFTVGAIAPVVTSINPTTAGQGATNRTITLTGDNFFAGATVSVSGTGVTPGTATVVNKTTITVPISVGSTATTGTRTMTVTNTDGQPGDCTNCLTITTKPVVSNLNPTSRGQGATDQVVTANGSGFANVASVTFSGTGVTASEITTAVGGGSATFKVSVTEAAATGARDVTVTNADGGAGVCTGCFTVNAKPTTTIVSPNNLGPGASNRTITITGTNYSTTPASPAVSFGDGITVQSATVDSATQITAVISVSGIATPGQRNVSIQPSDGGSAGVCTNCFTVNAPPVPTGAVPATVGQGATSRNITLTGTGFSNTPDAPAVAVSGTGVTVNSVTWNSATQLTVNVTVSSTAAASSTPRTVTVTNDDFGTGSCECLTISLKPSLTTVGPNQRGQGAQDQTLTLTGTNFVTGATVSFSGTGITADAAIVDSSTQITLNNVDIASNATTGAITVTVTNPDFGVAPCACFTVTAAPTVSAVTPPNPGNTSNDVTLTMTGSNLGPTATVILRKTGTGAGTIPDITGTNYSRQSTTQATIHFNLNGVAPGTWDIRLTNGDLGGPAACSCLVVSASGATVTAASPSAVGQGATKDVTITGTNFFPGIGVQFSVLAGTNGITVNSVTRDAVTPTTKLVANITVASNATAGARTITVTNTDGVAGSCITTCFSVNAAPTVVSISPTAGSNQGNVTITATGTGFDSAAGSAVLKRTGQPDINGTSYTFLSATQVRATFNLLNAAPGLWNLTITNADGGSVTCTNCFTATASAPTINASGGVSPVSYGQGASNKDVTITGTNFFPGITASFSGTGITVNSTTRNSTTELVANITIASDAPLTARNVTVTNTDSQSGTRNSAFTVVQGPSLTSASPSSRGQGATGQTVVLTGTNFIATPTVSFGAGITVTSVVWNSATQLTTTIDVDPSATPGGRVLTVTNPDTGVVTCSCFTVNAAPTVESATPDSRGQGASAQEILIDGANFLDSPAVPVVSFGSGITVTNVAFVDADDLTATISVAGNATPGARTITVQNADGSPAVSCTDCFTVNALPTFTSLDPTSRGQGAQNQVVTLNGTGFLDSATVDFGTGITLNDLAHTSSTQLTATISIANDATTGARSVSMTNNDGSSAVVCTDCFTLNAAPNIGSVVPGTAGQGATGREIVITGGSFIDEPTVSFGSGVTVTDVTYDSATQVTATIDVAPSATGGARTVTLTNPDGALAATCECFTINAAPTATSISPVTHENTGTQEITVTGSGFDTSNGSAFLEMDGQDPIEQTAYVLDSATQVRATFPLAGAAPGDWDVVVVNEDGGVGRCSECFEVTAAAPTLTNVDPSSAPQGATTDLTLTGANFFAGAGVSFSGTGITVNSTTVENATTITVNVTIAEEAPATARDVTVTNTDLQSGDCTSCFTVTAGPTITSIEPDSVARGATGFEITINGTGFATGATVGVSGSGVTVTSVVVNSASQITITVNVSGSAATGARSITVTNLNGGIATCSSCLTITTAPLFTFQPAPMGTIVDSGAEPVDFDTANQQEDAIDRIFGP